MFELSPKYPDRFFASNFSVGPVDFAAAAVPKADVRPARRRAVPLAAHSGVLPSTAARDSSRVGAWPNSAARFCHAMAHNVTCTTHLAQGGPPDGSQVPTGLIFSSLMVRGAI